jgi:hypothetical protein
MRLGQKVVTFGYMGVYWSVSVENFKALMERIERDEPFDLDEFGARQLRWRPAVLDYERITERPHEQ